jgi:hypothetical protein
MLLRKKFRFLTVRIFPVGRAWPTIIILADIRQRNLLGLLQTAQLGQPAHLSAISKQKHAISKIIRLSLNTDGGERLKSRILEFL